MQRSNFGQLIDMCVKLDEHLQHALGKCKKARKAFLRTIATGGVVGAVGTILATSGVILAPSTGGVSLMAASVGFGLLSNTLTVSAVFTNEHYTKKWIGKLVEILGEWQKLDKEYRKVAAAVKADKATGVMMQKARSREKNDEEAIIRLSTRMFSKEKIENVDDLEVGDHIFRRGTRGGASKDVSMISAYYHHGVYVKNNQVCDYVGGDYPRVVSLEKFLEGAPELFRRNYNGFDVTVAETLANAQKALVTRRKYKLLKCNCEHFATELKLGLSLSKQAQKARKVFDVVLTGGSALTGFGIGMTAGPVALGVLGPVYPASWLLFAASIWTKTPPSVQEIESFLNMIHVKRSEYEEELRQLTDGHKKKKPLCEH